MCFFWIVLKKKIFSQAKLQIRQKKNTLRKNQQSYNFCNEHSEKQHSSSNYFIFFHRLFLSSSSGEEELKARGTAASFLEDYYFKRAWSDLNISFHILSIYRYLYSNRSKKGYANGNVTSTYWQTGSKACHTSAEQTSII